MQIALFAARAVVLPMAGTVTSQKTCEASAFVWACVLPVFWQRFSRLTTFNVVPQGVSACNLFLAHAETRRNQEI